MSPAKQKTRRRGRPSGEGAYSTQFGKWLDRHGITRTAAAEALGITRQYVTELSNGTIDHPGWQLMNEIESWTRAIDAHSFVDVSSWQGVRAARAAINH